MKLLFGALVLGVAGAANASLLMDQIGSNPADMGGTISASQDFEAAFDQYDIAVIDDFTVSGGPATVTSVEAWMGLWNNANLSFNNVRSYRVEIFSSVAAAATSLTGDIYSTSVAAGSVGVNTGYSTSYSPSALVNIPTNFVLGNGTYFLGVIGVMDFGTAGQIGVGVSNYAGGFPLGANSYQANPGAGFGFTSNPLLSDAAYRMTANLVPEPATMAILGLGVLALAKRRRK